MPNWYSFPITALPDPIDSARCHQTVKWFVLIVCISTLSIGLFRLGQLRRCQIHSIGHGQSEMPPVDNRLISKPSIRFLITVAPLFIIIVIIIIVISGHIYAFMQMSCSIARFRGILSLCKWVSALPNWPIQRRGESVYANDFQCCQISENFESMQMSCSVAGLIEISGGGLSWCKGAAALPYFCNPTDGGSWSWCKAVAVLSDSLSIQGKLKAQVNVT